MNHCYAIICSEEYLGYYNILYQSLKTFDPEATQILYYIGDNDPKFDVVININDSIAECDPSYNRLEAICSLRAKVVLNSFKISDKVIFLGAKVQFFDYPNALIESLEDHEAVVTPHITSPLPEDGKFPSNASVSFTGHISTDIVAFKNTPNIVKFLEWQDQIMKTQVKTTNYTYLDQSWLNFLPFFVENVKILHDLNYNIAYYNYKQRELEFKNNKWITKEGRMVCFQFSGLDLQNPINISKHQNRYRAENNFFNFLTTYCNRVKEYKNE